jgi:hypothetical protein
MSPEATPDRRPIRERLAQFYSDVEIARMVVTPQDALHGRTPGEMIIAGHADEVHALIDKIAAEFFRKEQT